MTKIVNISIILILLAVTLGTASCNNSVTIHAPGSSTSENQSPADTDNITNQLLKITSQTDWLTDAVVKADLIVLGAITDNRTEVVTVGSGNTTGRFAYTLFTLSIVKVIKGDPSIKQAIIRLEGGYIGDGIYQLPTGRYFRISDAVLLGLIKQEDDIYTLFQTPQYDGEKFLRIYDSVFWIQGSAMSRAPLQEIMGRICKIMRINGITNSLNEPCPEPAEPASPPK